MSSGLNFNDAIEISIGVDFETQITSTEYHRYLKFRCVVGNNYTFRSFSARDTTATLYDAEGLHRAYDDDSGGSRNPMISFIAITEYMYVLVQGYSRPTGTTADIIRVHVEEMDMTRVHGVQLRPDVIHMSIDNTIRFDVIIEPETAINKNVTWEINHQETDDGISESVVTIDETGLITSVNYGYAYLMVTTEDGGFYDYCEVYVNPPIEPTSADLKSIPLKKLILIQAHGVQNE